MSGWEGNGSFSPCAMPDALCDVYPFDRAKPAFEGGEGGAAQGEPFDSPAFRPGSRKVHLGRGGKRWAEEDLMLKNWIKNLSKRYPNYQDWLEAIY